MDLPAINPRCDKDGASMYLGQMFAEESGPAFSTAYVCTSKDCDRCYSEGAGYFYFIGERPNLDHRQTLCEADALPMFLEIILSEDTGLWRCPGCNGLTAVRREQNAG